MAIRGWDALAAWRDYRMGEEGDLWHRAIIDPTVLEVVGPVRGFEVLDLACGNGYLTRRFARMGARRAVGIEHSRPTLAFAMRRERGHPSGAIFRYGNAHRLVGVADQSFDLVVANMALQDIPDAAAAIREVARVLRPAGRFVSSISHPCFDIDERSGWVVERVREPDGFWHDLVWRKVRQYREERHVEVPWFISRTETGWTTSYHRTLATYSHLLRDAGLAITRLEEPAPLSEAVRESPQGLYMLEVPLHLVIEARHFPGPSPLRDSDPIRRSTSRTWGGTKRKASRRSAGSARRTRTGSRV
jgi:ubiquinone/menaquinone biosynthesis C-methylase UbiE